MENITRYDFIQYDEWKAKINEITNGKYYTKLWQGFINYYNIETNERVGYEVMMDGFYLINNEVTT